MNPVRDVAKASRETWSRLRVYALFLFVVAGACETPQGGYRGPAPEGPNIIIVMTDDQGWGDLSGHGNPVLETPRLDQLAAESARLAEFYVHPVCTPTRAALMTGRHPQRTHAFDTYVGRAMLEPEEVTIAEVLRDAGWRTGIFGKWHLGDCAPMRPLDQGFERALVHRGGGIGQSSDPIGAEGKYTDPVLVDQGVERAYEGYCTDVFFGEALEWMGAQAEAGERFFCTITTNAPHVPLHDVPQALYEKYLARDLSQEVFVGEEGNQPAKVNKDSLARIYAMIENIDENMGRLVDFLEERELGEDTLLIFLCDNGPQGRRFVGGLRGSKGQVYEGGVRSPLFVRWPGELDPGEVNGDFGAHLDLFPTILEACGVGVPEGLELDGRSLLPLLRREEDVEPREPLVIQWNRGDAPVAGQNVMVRRGKWKLVNHVDGSLLGEAPPWRPELYDLERDPWEQSDFAAVYPREVERMTAIYQLWFMDVGAEMPVENANWTRRQRYGPVPIRIGGEGAERVVLTRQDWRRMSGESWGRNGVWSVVFEGGGLGADGESGAEDEESGDEAESVWDVRVVLPQGAQPERVVLGINSGIWTYITWEGEVVEGMREVVIQGVAEAWVPGRPAEVECRLMGGERGELGPHQLIFERSPAGGH
jgi:arylsulfatase/arylsulfatase A